MSLLTVNHGELERLATDVRAIAEEVEALRSRINQTSESVIGAGWTGIAADSFSGFVTGHVNTTFTQVYEKMNETAYAIDQTLAKYNEADSQLSGVWNV